MNEATVVIPFLPLLLGISVLAGVASYLLQSWSRLVALAGAGVATVLALILWQMDFSRPLWLLPNGWTIDMTAPVNRFGYTFQLQQSNLPVALIGLLVAAGALLLAVRASQHITFPAQVWMLVTGYTLLALMAAGPKAPALVAPLLLVMLSALGVFALQGAQAVNPAGPIRTLVPVAVAAPLFLIAAWYIDQVPLAPQDDMLTQAAGTLLGLGLLLLLTPFPLHSAMPATAETAPPPAVLLVSLLYQLAVLHLTAQVLTAYPFVLTQTEWPTWLSWLGLITAVWGGLAAMGAVNAGRLWGYAALHDWGLIVLVLAAPGLRSWTLVIFLFSLRAISMFTAAAGLSGLSQVLVTLDMQHLRGVGSRMPWSSAAFLLGGLGLVGFPLSAGFAGHWAALQTLAAVDWRSAAIVLVASVGAVVAFVRVARIMFGYLENRSLPREHILGTALAMTALVVTIGVAIAPQLLSNFVSRALAAFG